MSKYLARQETAISCEQGFAKNPDKAETKLALKTVVFRPKTERQKTSHFALLPEKSAISADHQKPLIICSSDNLA